MDNNWFKELFINEAKPALDRCGDNNTFVGESFETLTLSNDSTAPAQFSELVGLKVVEKMSGRRLLAASVERFEGEPETRLYRHRLSSNTEETISYGTVNGMLDTPCLTIDSAAMMMRCPSYFYDKPIAMLVYAFEEAHDTMGLGVTIPPGGWYAADGTTFTVEPFDQEQHPFFMTTDELTAYAENGAADYLYSLFQLAEEFTYTVSESNIFEYAGITCVYPMKADNIEVVVDDVDAALFIVVGLHNLCSFSIHDGDVWVGLSHNFTGKEEKIVTITYPVIKQLDPKFIPDGTPNIKQASIGDTIIVKAVDENGVPTAWESAIIHEKTLTAAKEYTDSQRLAYAEEKEYVFDGSLYEGDFVNIMGHNCCKVSDNVQDWGTAKSYTVQGALEGIHFEKTYYKEQLVSGQESVDGCVIFMLVVLEEYDEFPCAFSFSSDFSDESGNTITKGTYMLCGNPPSDFVSIVVEEIHRIDPKFLPAGGGIPTVVLETATVDNDAAYLSDAEVEALAAVFDKHDLVNVTRTGANGTVVSSLFQKNVNLNGTFYTSIYMDIMEGIPDFRIAMLFVAHEESTGTMMGVLSDMRSSILQIE